MRALSPFAILAAVAGVAGASDPDKLRRLMTDSRFLTMVLNSPSEWLRTAFHDAADYDAAAGTGGIDGSIYYETGYDANRGGTFTTVMTEYKFYQQDDVALADIVALGATLAVGACAGPVMPYYYGRTDSKRGSGEGFVPEPEQTTESHIDTFARMGFSAQEMISLIACGHTIGGVKAATNPTLTTDTYHHFDATHAQFDNNVAVGFVNDSRQNPLGQPWDPDYPGRSSDTRIFAVDNNATIKSYAEDSNKFTTDCARVLSKMLNSVPASVSLQGPLVPFPVSGTFWTTTRNGVFSITSFTGSARLYDMVGQWKSFEIGYTHRDGTEGTDGLVVATAVKEISNGRPIEVREFNTAGKGIPPATGLGSILIKVQLNDGSMYSSAEGQEVIPFDDSIMVDIGNQYTCKYSGEANNGANGLNLSAVVLGPYNPTDKVEMIFRDDTMAYTYITANYMGPRDEYYNIYNIFVADTSAISYTGFGAKLTRADGSESRATKDDVYFRTSTVQACVAGAEIPAPVPVPSAAMARRSRANAEAERKAPATPCPSGFSFCRDRCVNTWSNIEHCGGCAGAGGVDCTTLSDEDISCVAGRCVRG